LGIAAVIGGVAAILVVVLLVSGDEDGRSATNATFAASTPDEVATESLARQSIECYQR
jgi:hypothetical protein